MAQKLSYDANSAKAGMSLAELKQAITQTEMFIEGKSAEECKVTVFVNIRGGIKQIIMEV